MTEAATPWEELVVGSFPLFIQILKVLSKGKRFSCLSVWKSVTPVRKKHLILHTGGQIEKR